MLHLLSICVLLIIGTGAVTSNTAFTQEKGKKKWTFDIEQVSHGHEIGGAVKYRFQAKRDGHTYAIDMAKNDRIWLSQPTIGVDKTKRTLIDVFRWDGGSSHVLANFFQYHITEGGSLQRVDYRHRDEVLKDFLNNAKRGQEVGSVVKLMRKVGDTYTETEVSEVPQVSSAHASYYDMMADESDERVSARSGYGGYDYGIGTMIALSMIGLLCCACAGFIGCVIGFATSTYYIKARRKDATYEALESSQA